MTKNNAKETKEEAKEDYKVKNGKKPEEPKEFDFSKLPKEAQQKLKAIKIKLDKFKKKVVEKFDKYIMGIALMPPEKPEDGKEEDKEKINVLVLVDDSDSQKMSKLELKDKLTSIIISN